MVALAMLIATVACSVPPERSIVDEFFAASRLRDKTALQHVATVIFEPQINGIVESFDIKNVAAEPDNSKTVVIAARVKLPDGSMADQRIVLTLAHDDGKLNNDPASRTRWIVTGFIATAAPPPS